jgi:hypothetical protein
MTIPVVESIAQELESRLQAMVGSALYTTTVVEVIRPTRNGNYTPLDGQIVLTYGSVEPVPELMLPGEPVALAWNQTFVIHLHVLTDEESQEPIDLVVQQFAADLQKAVCITGQDWHRFGGWAIDSEWQSLQLIVNDGGLDGVALYLKVLYRVSERDPTVVRLS